MANIRYHRIKCRRPPSCFARRQRRRLRARRQGMPHKISQMDRTARGGPLASPRWGTGNGERDRVRGKGWC